MEFKPATNKLDAVNRLSSLSGSGPEALGPGSKERKSVLINLAIGLGIPFSHEFTKQELAAHLAGRFGKRWLPEFESRGQTITLKGLNMLLEAASGVIENEPLGIPKTVCAAFEDELNAIAEIVKGIAPLAMDGKQCVQEMRDVGHSNWKLVQWQGAYFEMKAAEALTSILGGGARNYSTHPLTTREISFGT